MFEISTDLKTLADKVIAKHSEFKPITESGCRIAYQYAEKGKKMGGKTVFADTMKVSDKMKAVAPFDFIITFYRPSCENLEPEKMEILMRHELKHIGIDGGKFKIVPHDIEDFRDIIKDHGMDWTI